MKKGSISLFLAFCLLFVLVLAGVLLENARLSGAKVRIKEAGDSAMNSLFAEYDRELFEKYGLLFYDGGHGTGGIDEDEILSDFESYTKKNLSKASLLLGGSFFPVSLLGTDVSGYITATDYSGGVFVKSALDFYKYDAASELLDEIKKSLKLIEEGDREKEKKVTEDSEEASVGESLTERGKDTTDGLIKSYNKAKKTGILALVLPAGTYVSGFEIDKSVFPSENRLDYPEDDAGSVLSDPVKGVAFNEYLLDFFPCYTSEYTRVGVQYELEYIMYGADTDDENLKKAVNRLLLLREGLNLMHIRNSEKNEETELAAIALVGWTGVEPLVDVVKFILDSAWAYAESISDLKILLSGGRVPLKKDSKSWKLSLKNAAGFLRGEEGSDSNDSGLYYEDYLRFLLFLQTTETHAFRAMDMVQANMQEINPGFMMESQLYALEIRGMAVYRSMFSNLNVLLKRYGIRPIHATDITFYSAVY